MLLGVLAVSAAFVGGWAQFAPHDWYTSFPGFGLRWVAPLGPYSEHMSRDVGGLYLALLVLSVGAGYRASDRYLSRLAGGAWAVFSLPHLIYHLGHLDMLNTRDQIGNVVTLGGTLLIALALLGLPYSNKDDP